MTNARNLLLKGKSVLDLFSSKYTEYYVFLFRTNEEPGGQRALRYLIKSELRRKPSKFRMHFCLGALNNVL